MMGKGMYRGILRALLHLTLPRSCESNRSQPGLTVPQGDIWQGQEALSLGREIATGISWIEGRAAAKHLTVPRTAL